MGQMAGVFGGIGVGFAEGDGGLEVVHDLDIGGEIAGVVMTRARDGKGSLVDE